MGFAVVGEQVGLMFFLILLGLLGARRGWIGPGAVTGMTNVLVYFATPAVIILAFNRPFTLNRLHDLGIAAAVAVVSYPLVVALVWLVYARVRPPELRRNLRFGGIYGNAGFLGIPLVQALFGADGVFFAAVYLAAFTVFVWTQGLGMFPSEPGVSPVKKLVSNPAIPSLAVGLVLFLASVRLPSIVVSGLGYLSALYAPMSMLVVGATLATVTWRTLATDGWLWVGVAARNVVIPALLVLALWVVPLSVPARLSLLIPMSTPVAAFLVMFSVMRHTDSDFPARLVCLSTLASVVSLPAVAALASALWS